MFRFQLYTHKWLPNHLCFNNNRTILVFWKAGFKLWSVSMCKWFILNKGLCTGPVNRLSCELPQRQDLWLQFKKKRWFYSQEWWLLLSDLFCNVFRHLEKQPVTVRGKKKKKKKPSSGTNFDVSVCPRGLRCSCFCCDSQLFTIYWSNAEFFCLVLIIYIFKYVNIRPMFKKNNN